MIVFMFFFVFFSSLQRVCNGFALHLLFLRSRKISSFFLLHPNFLERFLFVPILQTQGR